jgi:hypothetical protein
VEDKTPELLHDKKPSKSRKSHSVKAPTSAPELFKLRGDERERLPQITSLAGSLYPI